MLIYYIIVKEFTFAATPVESSLLTADFKTIKYLEEYISVVNMY